jgi:hypothetical protein
MAFDNASRAGYEKYYKRRAELAGWKPAGDAHAPARTAPVHIHYNEFHFGTGQIALAEQMKLAIGLDNAPVALIGSGFAWTAQGLVNGGTLAVVGTELSPYIHAAKDTTEEQDIRDYCARSGIDPDVHKVLCWPDTPGAQLLDGEWRISPLDWWLPRGAVPRSPQWLTIVDEDGSNNGSRGRIKNELRNITGSQTGDDIHHIITEEVLNSIDDPDAANLVGWLESASTQNNITPTGGADVFHMISPIQWDYTGDGDMLADLNDPAKWTQNNLQTQHTLNWKTYAEWRTFIDANSPIGKHKIIATATAIRQGMFAPAGSVVADRVRPSIEAKLIAGGMEPGAAAIEAAIRATAFGDWHEAVERVEQFEVF